MRNHDSAAVSHRNKIHSYAIWRLRVFSIIQTMQIKRSTHESRLDEALAYIAGHMKERIQLDHLSEASGVSKRTLGYLFLHTFGITPMAFVKRERLRKARMYFSKPTRLPPRLRVSRASVASSTWGSFRSTTSGSSKNHLPTPCSRARQVRGPGALIIDRRRARSGNAMRFLDSDRTAIGK